MHTKVFIIANILHGTKVCILFQQNYVKNWRAIAGFHCIQIQTYLPSNGSNKPTHQQTDQLTDQHSDLQSYVLAFENTSDITNAERIFF